MTQKSLLEKIQINSVDPTETLKEKFGDTFQTNLFKTFLYDFKFWDKYNIFLSDDLFSKFHGILFTIFKYYYNKYNSLPSKEIISELIKRDSKLDTKKDFLLELVDDIYDFANITNHFEYYEDSLKNFIKDNKIKDAFITAVQHYNSGEYPQIVHVLDTAVQSVDVTEVKGLDFFKSGALISQQSEINTIPTPFSGINKLLAGGLGKKELGLIMGGTGSGKSWMLQHLASHALFNNYNVMYFTFELSELFVSKRTASVMLNKNPEKITEEDINYLESEFRRKNLDNKYFIIEYPTKTCNVQIMRNVLREYKSYYSFIPDLIIVDYADLMLSVSKYSEKRYEISSIYEELRGLASEFNCAIWTASQVNRSGYNKKIVTVENIAEDFNKTTICDFILSIGRDIDDRVSGLGKAFVAKNRRGKDAAQFTMEMDLENGKISMSDNYDEVSDPTEYKQKTKNEINDDTIRNLIDKLD